jgi:hypothetical protein
MTGSELLLIGTSHTGLASTGDDIESALAKVGGESRRVIELLAQQTAGFFLICTWLSCFNVRARVGDTRGRLDEVIEPELNR